MMFLKRRFHFIVIMALPYCAFSQLEGRYTINGKLPAYMHSQNTVTAYLTNEADPSAKDYKIDSSKVINGSFQFNGIVTQPQQGYLWLRDDSKGHDAILEQRTIWLEKGQIRIEGKDSLLTAAITGSPILNDQQEFEKLKASVGRAIDSLNSIKYSGKTDSAYKANVLNPALNAEWKKMRQIIKKFIAEHPKSFYSVQLLATEIHSARQLKSDNKLEKQTIGEFEKLYNQFDAKLKSTPMAAELQTALSGLKAAEIGDQVMHFALKGIDGKIVDTRKLKGRVLLIDFWGSWCPSCRKSHPHLKELYQQYKPKGFEIIGISKEYGSKETQIKKWKQAVAEDQIDWLQVLSGEGKDDVVIAYGIGAYPTKILVDASGKIVLRVTDDVERKLDEMLEKLLSHETTKK